MEIDSNTFIIILVLEIFIFIGFFFGSFLNIVIVIIFVRRRGFRTTSNRWKIEITSQEYILVIDY